MASDKKPPAPTVGRASTNRVYVGIAPSVALAGAFRFGHVEPVDDRRRAVQSRDRRGRR